MIDEAFSHTNVLIVDDERDMRYILHAILRDMGLRNVHEAHDVRDALHIIKTSMEPIDLILCDWNMPGRPGLDLLKELHMEGGPPAFLIVSGRGDHDSVVTAKKAGVAGYIRKPFSPKQVETRILGALQRTQESKVL